MLHTRALSLFDKKNYAAVYLLKIFHVTPLPPHGGLVVTVIWNAAALDSVQRWQLEMQSTHRYRHTFPPFPLLSNLGHILCGRLGHTIPLGFEGIWWTSGPSLNLNIWITERCVNMSLCLTFRTFSLLKLNCWVPRVSFFPPSSVYSFPCASPMVCSSSALTSQPLQLYLLVSRSFKMYIHTELNITVMPLLSVLYPPLSHTHTHTYIYIHRIYIHPPTMFSWLFFPHPFAVLP